MAEFVRLAEVVNKKKDMRVVSVTVVPTIADCSGRIWFTDLQLQEGSGLAGYDPHTETCLQKLREDGGIKAPVWFNGVVRSEETVILFNLGKTSAPLDIHILVLCQKKVQVKRELHLNILNYTVSISSFLNSFQYFFSCSFGDS